jgi:hypothetical protein
LLITLLFAAHFWGIGFIEIGHISVNSNKNQINWIEAKDLSFENPIDLYINAMYFSIITMVSVGYGDITPINNSEKIYISVMTIFSSMNFAYVVNTIGSIFSQ